MTRIALLALLVSCTTTAQLGPAPDPPPATPPVDPTPPTLPDPDPEPQPDPIRTTEVVPGMEGIPYAWVFDKAVVHEVEILVNNAGVGRLLSLPYEWVPAEVLVDGERAPAASVRLRGKIGSFRELTGKPKFKIDFNKIDLGRRFHGLEALALNNSVGDCSYLREAVVYRAYELAGVAAPRIAWTRVRFNGEDYGLYQIVEYTDDRFLHRAFTNGDGNLYDGKYQQNGWWLNVESLDFEPGLSELMQLEEGVDVGNADVNAITEAIALFRDKPEYYDEVGRVLAWPEMLSFLAVEHWTHHWDGYALNQNNYRVYFDPTDGLGRLVPWDTDNSLPDGGTWLGSDWDDPSGIIAETCLDDATCALGFRDAAELLLEQIAAADVYSEVQAWRDLTQDDARTDPKRECSLGEMNADRGFVERWVRDREAAVRTELGLP